jgi:hypothetical protein
VKNYTRGPWEVEQGRETPGTILVPMDNTIILKLIKIITKTLQSKCQKLLYKNPPLEKLTLHTKGKRINNDWGKEGEHSNIK